MDGYSPSHMVIPFHTHPLICWRITIYMENNQLWRISKWLMVNNRFWMVLTHPHIFGLFDKPKIWLNSSQSSAFKLYYVISCCSIPWYSHLLESIVGNSLTVWWWIPKCSRLTRNKHIQNQTNHWRNSVQFKCVTNGSLCFSKTFFLERVW